MSMSENERIEAQRLYPLGWSCGMLAERYGTTASAMQNMLKRRGVVFRPATKRNKHLPVNHSAFCLITDESAYWAGFLMADGCIVTGFGSPQITLSLSVTDIDHVRRFKQFLQAGHAVVVQSRSTNTAGSVVSDLSQNSKDTARLSVSSSLIASDLERFGVVPRKTHTAEVKEIHLNKHFWRGVIDGDGTIVTGPKPYIALASASQRLVEQFSAYCLSVSPGISQHIGRPVGLWRFTISGRTCEPILSELYRNLSVALPRKKNKAWALLERFSAQRRVKQIAASGCNGN